MSATATPSAPTPPAEEPGPPAASRAARDAILVLGLVLLNIAWAGPLLDRGLTHDEIVTVEMFALQEDWRQTVSLYPYPNNHLLHSLLVSASIRVFGLHDWAIRLPAFLGHLGFLAAMVLWLRRHAPTARVLVYVLLLNATALVLGYGVHARGYSLVLAFSTVGVLCLVRYGAEDRSAWWCLAGWLAMVLATYTVPSAGFLCIGLGLYLISTWWLVGTPAGAALRRRRPTARRVLVDGAIMTASVLTLALLHWPVYAQMRVAMRSFGGTFSLAGTLEILGAALQLPWPAGVGVVGLCLLAAWRRLPGQALPLTLCLATPLTVVCVLGLGPPVRAFVFCVPLVWWLVMAGSETLWQHGRLPGRCALGALALTHALVVLGPGVVQMRRQPTATLTGELEEDWKAVLEEALVEREPAQLPVLRARRSAAVVNTCVPPTLARPALRRAHERLAARWAAELTTGPGRPIVLRDVVFANIWRQGEAPAAPPLMRGSGLRIARRRVRQHGVAEVWEERVTIPPVVHRVRLSSAGLRTQQTHAVNRVEPLPDRTGLVLHGRARDSSLAAVVPIPAPPAGLAPRYLSFSCELEHAPGQTSIFNREYLVRWGTRRDYVAALSPGARPVGVDVWCYVFGVARRVSTHAQLFVHPSPGRHVLWGIAPYAPGRYDDVVVLVHIAEPLQLTVRRLQVAYHR